MKKDNGDKINKAYLTAQDICEYFGIPLSTIYRLSKQGKIRAIKIGKQWRYLKSSVEQYSSSGTGVNNGYINRINNIKDQRALPRINCNLPCGYTIDIPSRKNIISQGSIYNISGGGILLINNEGEINKVDVDDPVLLDFKIAHKGSGINIETEGRIVRKTNVGLGIKFRNINKEKQNEIMEYIG